MNMLMILMNVMMKMAAERDPQKALVLALHITV